MGATPAENVDVKAVGLGEEDIGLGGDEGEALEEANAQGSVGDDLADGQRGGLDVIAAANDFEIRGDGAKVVVRRAVGQVAQAEGL